jgi:spermidine synthase
MASPFALRLSITDLQRAGRTSGRLSSFATIGAIVGTFGSALVLIPAIGTQRTLLVAALATALVCIPLVPRRAGGMAVVIAGLIAVPAGPVKPADGALAEAQSLYQYIQVVRNPDGKIVMRTDEGVADQSVYRSHTALTGGEWDMPLVVPPLLSAPLRSVLVLGNAGGTTARALASQYPGVAIDGVELDQTITDLARRYMGMDGVAGLRVITGDARAYVATATRRYDLIVVDTYRQTYIPFYVTTREFFQQLHDRLNPGGAIALNVERVPGDDRLVEAISGTIATTVAQVWVWPALRFNELVVGLDRPIVPATVPSRLTALPAAVQVLAPLVAATAHTQPPASDPLTDDHAPVEWLTDRAVLAYIAAGGGSRLATPPGSAAAPAPFRRCP